MVSPAWQFTPTATKNTLIVVEVVTPKVLWAAGGGFQATHDGAIVRSIDGGVAWRDVTPPQGDPRLFRDVKAFDADHALALTTGSGPASRIYRTDDGGRSWRQVFHNTDHPAFYDSMAFFSDHRRGLAVSDSVDGAFPIQATDDSGRTWNLIPTTGLSAHPGEGLRATGTSVVAIGERDAWFGTTGAEPGHPARVFHTTDGGTTWTVTDTPIPGPNPAAGIVSLSFRDRHNGLAVGGTSPQPDGTGDVGVVARTSNGGQSWRAVGAPAGFRNSVAWIPDQAATAVVVGHRGSDLSTAGQKRIKFDTNLLLGVAALSSDACWAVGQNGRAAQLRI